MENLICYVGEIYAVHFWIVKQEPKEGTSHDVGKSCLTTAELNWQIQRI